MSKRTEKMLHGSCSEVYINGVRDDLATKIEVKVTGDFEDGAFCGDYGTFPIYNGYAIEGTITDKKHRHHAGHRADYRPHQPGEQADGAVEHFRRGIHGSGPGQY